MLILRYGRIFKSDRADRAEIIPHFSFRAHRARLLPNSFFIPHFSHLKLGVRSVRSVTSFSYRPIIHTRTREGIGRFSLIYTNPDEMGEKENHGVDSSDHFVNFWTTPNETPVSLMFSITPAFSGFWWIYLSKVIKYPMSSTGSLRKRSWNRCPSHSSSVSVWPYCFKIDFLAKAKLLTYSQTTK